MREYRYVTLLSVLAMVAHFLQNIALYFIAVLAPFLIQPVINLLTIRSWWDFHNGTNQALITVSYVADILIAGTLGCTSSCIFYPVITHSFRSVILGLSMTGAVTQAVKITVGRPRYVFAFSKICRLC